MSYVNKWGYLIDQRWPPSQPLPNYGRRLTKSKSVRQGRGLWRQGVN